MVVEIHDRLEKPTAAVKFCRRVVPKPVRILLFESVEIVKQFVNLYIDLLDRSLYNFTLVFKQVWSFAVSGPLYIINCLFHALILLVDFLRENVQSKIDNTKFAIVVYTLLTPLTLASLVPALLSTAWLTVRGPKLERVTDEPAILKAKRFGVHKYARLPGIRLHYVEKGGDDKPLLLFLHGFGEFWFSWRNQILNLSDKYRTVAVDLPGYGKSGKPKSIERYQLHVLVRELKYLIEHLNPNQKQKCYVVAHGWGAIILYCFLLQYADLVNAYVTLNTAPPYIIKVSIRQIIYSWLQYVFLVPFVATRFLRAYFPKYLLDVYNRLPDAYSTIDAYMYTFGNPGAFVDPLKYYRANILIMSAYMTEGIINLPLNRMPPGLCMYGNEDDQVSEDIFRYTAFIPNLETLKVLQANHQMNELRSDLINKIIRRYFDNLIVRDNVISIAAELYAEQSSYPINIGQITTS